MDCFFDDHNKKDFNLQKYIETFLLILLTAQAGRIMRAVEHRQKSTKYRLKPRISRCSAVLQIYCRKNDNKLHVMQRALAPFLECGRPLCGEEGASNFLDLDYAEMRVVLSRPTS